MSDRVIELLLKARDETGGALRSMRGNVDQAKKSTDGLGNALKTVGMFLGVRELMQFAGGAMKAAGDLYDMSVKTRLSAETLSAWSYAADASGTSIENLVQGVKFLRRNLYEATEGSKEATEAFGALGLSANELKEMGTERAMSIITKRLSEMRSETDRTAIAVKIFGRGGDSILILGDQLDVLTERAKALGLVITDDVAKAMDELGDKQAEVLARSKTLTAELMTHLGPALLDTAEGLMRILSRDFAKDQAALQRSALPSPMGADNPWWHNPQRIGRGAPGGNYVSNPLWYQAYSGATGEGREAAGTGGRRVGPMGLPTGPQNELGEPYEDASTDWDITELGLPPGMQSDARRFMDPSSGRIDVTAMIADARREASELEDTILGVSDRMADSAEEADRVRQTLSRAHQEGAERLAQGMVQFFSIVSGGNSQWVQQLQTIYQMYRTIADIAQALRLVSMTTSDVTGVVSGAGNSIGVPSVDQAKAGTTINLLVANPQSRMDALELGRRAAEAGEEYDRRFR